MQILWENKREAFEKVNKEKFLDYLERARKHCLFEFRKYWRFGPTPDSEKEEYFIAEKELIYDIKERIKRGEFDD